MLIRIEGTDLPGLTFNAEDGAGGHTNVHVAMQGRNGQQDLVGLVPADAPAARWDLEVTIASARPLDVLGPQVHGGPGHRFLYVTWGDVSRTGAFRMFRRAKVWLDVVPEDVVARALERDLLVGRLALSDAAAGPLSGSVRPPLVEWSA